MNNIESLKQNSCIMHWTGERATANAPKAITAAGDVKQILPFPGAGIGMFDGNGDYLSFNNTPFTLNLTIEMWVYIISVPWTDYAYVFINDSTRGTELIRINTVDATSITYNINGGNTTVTGLNLKNKWNHIALVSNNGNVQLYINGIAVGNSFTATTVQQNDAEYRIGRSHGLNSYYPNGYLSEYRISSIARYTANFTPPRRQLESDEHTKLLLHFNRNDTTFVDSSPSAHTITAYGNAKQLCSPCGSGVAYFDGNGDYLYVTYLNSYDYGSSNFTIETWIFNTTTSGKNQHIYSYCSSGGANGAIGIWFPAGARCIRVYINNTAGTASIIDFTSSTTVTLNTWTHIALVRNGSTFTLYFNGTSVGSGTSSDAIYCNSDRPFAIGRAGAYAVNGYFFGNISEVRVSDVARYTSDFTPQTTPFKPDSYTKLLLHMDGVGNAFYDSSDAPGDNGFPILPDGVTVTPAGTFAVQKLKNGCNSLVYDGSTNGVDITCNSRISPGIGDFTVCAWIKSSIITTGTMRLIALGWPDATTVSRLFIIGIGYNIGWGTGVRLTYEYSSTSAWTYTSNISPELSLSNNIWYHIVIKRQNGTVYFYVNGLQVHSFSDTTYLGSNSTLVPINTIGYRHDDTTHIEWFNGNIKDLMIFKKALTVDQIGAIIDETYIF